jgi:hypothetical protein
MTASQPRFGPHSLGEVSQPSQKPTASPPGERAAPARYSRWFFGADGTSESQAIPGGGYRRDYSDMTAAEIAAATKDNLSILGQDANAIFLPRLPKGHRFRQSNRPSILAGMPHLGTCKFGEIITSQNPRTIAVTQVFVANFEGDIDTSNPLKLFRPSTAGFQQMFFGLHLLLDRQGNYLTIDRSRGSDGVAFRTKNISTALCNIASTSTGLPLNDLLARADAARKNGLKR